MIIEGHFVTHEREFEGQVEVLDGIIARVGIDTELGTPDFKYPRTHRVFPGMSDIHIHAREDATGKQCHKETYTTANAAALNGGVVAAGAMPNQPEPVTTLDRLAWHAQAHADLPVSFMNYVGIGPNTEPLEGDLAHKLYTGPSVGDLFFTSEQGVRDALTRYVGRNVSFHVEDFDVLMENEGQPTHQLRRPVHAVNTALAYVLPMIEEFELDAKLCHWSTGGESFEMIQAHRARQQAAGKSRTTLEVSPLHLIFDADMLKIAPQGWPYVQMNPALQGTEHRVALVEGLRDGTIDYLATDHAPHTLEEKFKKFADLVEGGETREQAYLRLLDSNPAKCNARACLNGTSGTPQLDTYGLVAAWLITDQGFTPERVAEVTSYNPGKFMSRFSDAKLGDIAVGYDGSFTVLDMGLQQLCRERILKQK